MKIAVPTRGKVIDDHFGHCELFTVFTINQENNIEKTDLIPSLQGCGCKSNIAGTLQQSGVSIMLAGNMGDGALNKLNMSGIKVYRGCSGEVEQAVLDFLNGRISDVGDGCNHHHHSEGHSCSH